MRIRIDLGKPGCSAQKSPATSAPITTISGDAPRRERLHSGLRMAVAVAPEAGGLGLVAAADDHNPSFSFSISSASAASLEAPATAFIFRRNVNPVILRAKPARDLRVKTSHF